MIPGQLPIPDPVTEPAAREHADATPTESAARRRIEPVVGKLRGNVLLAIVSAGDRGLTAAEAVEVLGLPPRRHYSVAPRLSELKRDGYVTDEALITRDGFAAYVVTEVGRAWFRRQR